MIANKPTKETKILSYINLIPKEDPKEVKEERRTDRTNSKNK